MNVLITAESVEFQIQSVPSLLLVHRGDMNGILKVSLGISCGNTKANGPTTGGDLNEIVPPVLIWKKNVNYIIYNI